MRGSAGLLATVVDRHGSRFGVIVELGTDQALLESSHPREKGEALELRFFVPRGATFARVSASGEVEEVRDPEALQYVVRLRELDERSRRILDDYVASRKR